MGVAERKAREFQKRENEILDAAFELFLAHGLEQVTIDMIADAVEIGKGTVYTHFKSKHEIYAALFIKFLDEINEELKEIDESLSHVDKLRAIIRVYIDYWLKNNKKNMIFQKCLHNLTLENLGPKLLEKVKYHHNCKHEQHLPLIKKAIEDGILIDAPPEYIVLIVAGMLQGISHMLAEDHFEHSIEESDALFSFVEQFLIRGLLK